MIIKKRKSNHIIALTVSMLFLLSIGCIGCSSKNTINNDTTKQNVPIAETQNNTASIGENFKDKSPNGRTNSLPKFNLNEAKVSRVVDGDTLELSDGSKVRLIGVNTPESTTITEAYGKEASNYTKSQLTGKTIYLEKDISETDKYGRLLRYVWLSIPEEINDSEIRNKMFNAILVQNGYAELSTYPPDVKYKEYFAKYNSEARNANLGLWAINHNGTTKGDLNTISDLNSSGSSNSNNFGISPNHSLIKGNINSKGEKIYHIPGSQFYDKTTPETWFNTEAEAQATGYRKSKR